MRNGSYLKEEDASLIQALVAAMPTRSCRVIPRSTHEERSWRIAMNDGVSGAPRVAPWNDVLASEAATYAFCAKAWHLEHALRRPASRHAVERRAAGTALHEEHGELAGRPSRTGTRFVLWSLLLLGLAAVLLILALFADR